MVSRMGYTDFHYAVKDTFTVIDAMFLAFFMLVALALLPITIIVIVAVWGGMQYRKKNEVLEYEDYESLEGWYADPYFRYTQRYFDGEQWTEFIEWHGVLYSDPVTPEQIRAQILGYAQ